MESDRADYVGDPDCVFGLRGAAYFATLPLRRESTPAQTLVYRSADAGLTWASPIELPYIDREYLTVDQTSGKYRGRIYLQGNETHVPTVDGDGRVVFTLFRSSDGAATFGPPLQLIPDGTHVPFGNGNGEVLSDGSYVAVFPEWTHARSITQPQGAPAGLIKIVRSENGGDSFTKASVISPWYWCKDAGEPGLPMIAADHTGGPFKDRLYAVWSDSQSGHCDVRFSYSTDKGKTWSRSKVINDEPNRLWPDRFANHGMPVVAVNFRGVVGISWYDRRDSPDNTGWWTRFTASLDGGETFLPSVRASEAPEAHTGDEALPIWIVSQRATIHIQSDQGERFGGDTGGLAADANGIFHPLWVDNRTGILQLWTSAVTVSGGAVRNGSEDLAALNDVTGSITLEYANTNYDPKTALLAFDTILRNTSTAPIAAPIKLRVTGIVAGSGSARISNADNHQSGAGAVWDFSNVVPGGVLNPGDKSSPKRFEFLWHGRNGVKYRDLITLESKVLAR